MLHLLLKTFQLEKLHSSIATRELAHQISEGFTDLRIRISSYCANTETEYLSKTIMTFKFVPSIVGNRRLTRRYQAMRIGVVALSILVAVSSTKADQVTTAPGFGPYFIGDGGEFTVTPDAGVAAMLGGYVNGVTANIVGFSNSCRISGCEDNRAENFISCSSPSSALAGYKTSRSALA